MIKDLDDEGLGQNKVLRSFFRSRTANGQTATTGSPTLHAPGRQISSLLPVSGSRTALTRIPPCYFFFIASSLLPHLAHFLAHPVSRPCFRFAGSWIDGLAMGRAESRGVGADSSHLVLFVVAWLKL